MKGKVECRFVGGPGGDEELELPAMACRDRVGLDQDGWLEARSDGGANVMRGPRPPDANWEAFTRAVYEKDVRRGSGPVTYRFVRLDLINRCAGILKSENRRCMHEAQAGSKYCRQHGKKSNPP
jgi:hypothetical protein